MIEDLLRKNNGDELLSKNDLDKDMVGVEIQSTALHGIYAFPDRKHAEDFMLESSLRFASESMEVTVSNIFENISMTQKILNLLKKSFPKIRELSEKKRFEKQLIKNLAKADYDTYGMSFKEASNYACDEKARETFKEKFGISYNEYLIRIVNGELMGDSIKNGKWASKLEEQNDSEQ